MAKIRKPKPRPLYRPGMILAVKNYIPPFLGGDLVSVLEVRPATFDVRYQVQNARKQTGWLSQADLALPLEMM